MSSLDDQLDWTAAQYVMGELGPEEAAQFESLLAEDQKARDAVANAVFLLQASAVGRPVALPKKSTSRVIALAVAIAACFFVGVAIYLTPNSTQSVDAGHAQPKLVASTTSDDWILDLSELLEVQVAADDAETVDALDPASFEETESEVPGWLILATSKDGMP